MKKRLKIFFFSTENDNLHHIHSSRTVRILRLVPSQLLFGKKGFIRVNCTGFILIAVITFQDNQLCQHIFFLLHTHAQEV